MSSINVFSHDTIISHLQDCTSRMWDKCGSEFEVFRQPWGVKRLKVEETSNKKWTEFGKVKDVHIYPLLKGKKQPAICYITNCGLFMKSTVSLLRDRQFILYTDYGVINKVSNRYRTDLSDINVQAVGNNTVKFTAPEMSPLIINLDFLDQNLIQMDGAHIFHNELFQELQYIDCGQCAADWFSKYLSNEREIVRLAFSPLKTLDFIDNIRAIVGTKFYGLIDQWNEWLMITLLSILDSIIISTEVPLSFSNLSEHWSSLNDQSNIVIAADPANSFAQDEWDLLKIGTAIIRNPYSRKTRKPRNISDITNRYLAIGLNCMVINTGIVKPGDKVYIMRTPDPSLFP